jgi:exodeoxyribonuclease V alpha subunit
MLDNGLFDPEELGDVFDETDRLLVDGAIRIAGRQGGPLDVDAALYRALLCLAKAMRHGHAAIDLDPDTFGDLVEEVWVRRGDAGEMVGADLAISAEALREALLGADERLLGRASLEDTVVDGAGAPFLVTMHGDEPRFASSRRFAAAECAIAGRLLAAATSLDDVGAQGVPLPNPDDIIELADQDYVTTEVAAFIAAALTRRISILTGGPGTGKTTAIATMLRAMGLHARREGRAYRIALCAPTAKAAVRMREALEGAFGGQGLVEFAEELEIEPRSGSIHRLLAIRPDAMASDVELACDLVIVDEVSMLELDLMDQLLCQCGASHVLLVGDPDQLTSVDVGAVLRDVVEAGREPGQPLSELITRLTTYHRGTPVVAELAAAINSGDVQAVNRVVAAHPESLRIVADHEGELASVVEVAASVRTAALEGEMQQALTLLGAQAVLCGNREGPGSVAWWQDKVAAALESVRARVPGGPRFAVGTPIMVVENEQSPSRPMEERLSNGDVGVVVQKGADVEAYFLPASTAPRSRQLRALGRTVRAWAFTIHKSQGSEYTRVVVSLPTTPNRILSRQLLYTAVTRAKEEVVIVGSEPVLRRALEHVVDRVSGLPERLAVRAASGS